MLYKNTIYFNVAILKTLTPEYPHTYWAAHFQATRKAGQFCSSQEGRPAKVQPSQRCPHCTTSPRKQGAAALFSWAFASTVNYSLSVFQTGIDPSISSSLPSPFYGFVPVFQDKSSCTILADICQPTSQIYWAKISQAPHEIHSPALLPILLLKWFCSYPGLFFF